MFDFRPATCHLLQVRGQQTAVSFWSHRTTTRLELTSLGTPQAEWIAGGGQIRTSTSSGDRSGDLPSVTLLFDDFASDKVSHK